MDIKKYEKLINLVINEDLDKAHELFHEIVVEKSREIFESIMAEEDMEEGMGGQVGDLLDEIDAEESGVMEDDEADIEFDDEAEDAGHEMTHDLEMDHDTMDHEDEHEEHEEIEDAVIRIEDKLDQLMAEFEEIMGGEAHDDDEEEGDEEEEEGDEEEMDEDMMMENITLQKVPVHHGDDGAQRKSTVASNSGQAGMASKPVKFAGYSETVPTSPKKPHDAYTKGEGNLPGAGAFKNVPGKNNFADMGEKTPKPVKKDESSNHKSPVAESRRTPRRPVR